MVAALNDLFMSEPTRLRARPLLIFSSRWFQLPLYLGLIVALPPAPLAHASAGSTDMHGLATGFRNHQSVRILAR